MLSHLGVYLLFEQREQPTGQMGHHLPAEPPSVSSAHTDAAKVYFQYHPHQREKGQVETGQEAQKNSVWLFRQGHMSLGDSSRKCGHRAPWELCKDYVRHRTLALPSGRDAMRETQGGVMMALMLGVVWWWRSCRPWDKSRRG